MKVDLVMPQMGESIAEGTILKWHKKVGDKIDKDETILEISTDKVDSEIPSPAAGVVAELIIPEGETVSVGTLVARIETEGSSGAVAEQVAQATPPPAATATQTATPVSATTSSSGGATMDVVMPQMGESIAEGTILKWHKKVGDAVAKDETILEISTDKVDSEIPSPAAGTLAAIVVAEGETVSVGTLIAKIASGDAVPSTAEKVAPAPTNETKASPVAQPATKVSTSTSAIQVPSNGGTAKIPTRSKSNKFYSPLVRNIAEKEGITLEELEQLPGSGADGRVTKKDVLGYLTSRKPGAAVRTAAASGMPAKQVQQVQYGYQKDRVELIEMTNIRKLTAEHMRRSLDTSAHVYSVTEVDMSRVVRFRNQNKDAFMKKYGVKLTFTPFILEAMMRAVKDYPMINISVDGTTIIKKNYINLGMAVSIENNTALIVPVIKNADMLNLSGIARAANDLALRARDKKIKPDEIQDGTITLTNMGVFGSTVGFPVINQPQVAIVGVGTIKKRPVVIEDDDGDKISIRPIMFMSISYDHRVVDGALGGSFLKQVAHYLENFDVDLEL